MTIKDTIVFFCFVIAVICFCVSTFLTFGYLSTTSAQLRLVAILAIPVILLGLLLVL